MKVHWMVQHFEVFNSEKHRGPKVELKCLQSVDYLQEANALKAFDEDKTIGVMIRFAKVENTDGVKDFVPIAQKRYYTEEEQMLQRQRNETRRLLKKYMKDDDNE